MIKNRFKLLFIVLIGIVIGCNNSFSDLTSRDVSSIYNPSSSNVFPEYDVFHKNDSISLLKVRFKPTNLYFARTNDGEEHLAKVQVRYLLFDSYEKGNMLDSNSVIITIERSEKHITKSASFRIPIKKGNYLLEVQTADLLKNATRIELINIKKEYSNTPQHYLLQSSNGGVVFNNCFKHNEEFQVLGAKENQQFHVFHYNEIPDLPPPPYDETKKEVNYPKPDSSYVINIENGLTIKQQAGIMALHADSAENRGLCSYNFNDNYPFIRTTKEMAEALRYISKKIEYDKIVQSDNKKQALDDFWVSIGKDENKARELIKVYYRRVLFANVYFTSYTEGWRTDRGMVYVVFGEPTSIYKTSKEEHWSYNNNKNMRPLVFKFKKSQLPYTDNHFVLKRNRSHQYEWGKAIKSWRSGYVFYF